jgi:hypothetical protein
LRWFEAYSCKSAPRGLPSSFAQLHAITGEKKTTHLFTLVAHYAVSIVTFSEVEFRVIFSTLGISGARYERPPACRCWAIYPASFVT